MTRRTSRFAALLIVALAAMALAVGHTRSTDHRSSNDSVGETAFVARADTVDAPVVRTSDPHRQSNASERLLKQRLILFALVAAVFAGLVLSRRFAIMRAQSGRVPSTLWLPQRGRGPPAFSI